jgi:predicted nucleic acid-binding protein
MIVTWWATRVECASARGRLRREGSLDEAGFGASLRRLTTYAAAWAEVEHSAAVRRTALRLLRVHPLHAADALQLAAALAAADIEGFPVT